MMMYSLEFSIDGVISFTKTLTTRTNRLGSGMMLLMERIGTLCFFQTVSNTKARLVFSANII